jgi:hypothetical protein
MNECDYCQAESPAFCTFECQCPECMSEREAIKDRDFDEKVALAYI